MANPSSKKPVNDLIKFWAEKQEKKDLEPASRSLRRPLFPNASLPATPLNESFSKTPFRDIPSNSPPSTPTKQFNNIHSLISEGKDNSANNNNSTNNSNSTIDTQTSSRKNEERVENNSISRCDSPNEETPSLTSSSSSSKDSYITRTRDHDLNTKDKVGLPPVRKVTDLVSKFERVTSPTNSVSTSPRLTPIKQSTPTSPLALSPIKRIQPTLEPLTLPPLNSKAKRRQTVPEPLTLKPITNAPTSISTVSNKNLDSTPISPISPIENKRVIPSTQQKVSEVQTQKKQTQQESLSNQSLKSNNTPSQKKVSESNPKPVIVNSIKQSDPEPLQQKQAQPTSPVITSDYLDFLSETLKSLQTTSFNSSEITLWNPESDNKSNKTVPEKNSHSRSKTFTTSRGITKVNFEISNNKSKNNYEIPDLLPQPEPISPIRLNFSDFLLSNGSVTNLNANDKKDVEKEKLDDLDMSAKKSDIHKVVKSEVPKKDENSSTNKRQTIQIIENLRRYLQPNKYKNSDIINISTRKVASQY